MKKLFFALAFLASMDMTSQVLASGTVMITKAAPLIIPPNSDPYVCSGDTMVITFKFKFSGNPDMTQPWYLHFTNEDNTEYLIRNFFYNELISLPRTVIGLDTFYTYKHQVPPNFLPTSLDGHIRVEFNANGIYPGKTIYIQKCLTTGIQVYQLDPATRVYFDIYGHKVEPQKNEILMKGTTRKKILITEEL